jgi:hypothetical protein
MGELRGDMFTLAAKFDPGAASEATQKAAALHASVSQTTEVACSVDGALAWTVGVATQVDDVTAVKMRVGAKEEGKDGGGYKVDCHVARKVGDLQLMVSSAIDSRRLTDFNAHRFGVQALYEM